MVALPLLLLTVWFVLSTWPVSGWLTLALAVAIGSGITDHWFAKWAARAAAMSAVGVCIVAIPLFVANALDVLDLSGLRNFSGHVHEAFAMVSAPSKPAALFTTLLVAILGTVLTGKALLKFGLDAHDWMSRASLALIVATSFTFTAKTSVSAYSGDLVERAEVAYRGYTASLDEAAVNNAKKAILVAMIEEPPSGASLAYCRELLQAFGAQPLGSFEIAKQLALERGRETDLRASDVITEAVNPRHSRVQAAFDVAVSPALTAQDLRNRDRAVQQLEKYANDQKRETNTTGLEIEDLTRAAVTMLASAVFVNVDLGRGVTEKFVRGMVTAGARHYAQVALTSEQPALVVALRRVVWPITKATSRSEDGFPYGGLRLSLPGSVRTTQPHSTLSRLSAESVSPIREEIDREVDARQAARKKADEAARKAAEASRRKMEEIARRRR